MQKLTPAMQQYMDIKAENRDCLILFRMGDFYETFFDDAKTIAKELEITLTKRGKVNGRNIPLAGIPYRSLDTYLTRLVKKGFKVAIVEQLEDPKKAKGLVKRGLIKIVTPGTLTTSLNTENNFIMSISFSEHKFGIAAADISTGKFHTTEVDTIDEIHDEIAKFNPTEILIPSSEEENTGFIEKTRNSYLNFYPDFNYYPKTAENILKKHFNVASLDGFGLKDKNYAISASGSLMQYLIETQKTSLKYINKIIRYSISQYMALDTSTIRNLELLKNIYDGSTKGTLISILDKTKTPMGKRLLKRFVQMPLLDLKKIIERHNAVEELYLNNFLKVDLITILKKVYDIERLISKVNYGNANPRDLISLKSSLDEIPVLSDMIKKDASSALLKKLNSFPDFSAIAGLIEKAIIDEPPATILDGNIIKNNYHEKLDEYRAITKDAKRFISSLEEKEKEKTGIKSLKIRFNKVFGYFIEVTKKNISMVPDNYIKKQTLVNCERFITEELKEKESLILGAEEKMIALEKDIFNSIIETIQKHTEDIQQAADNIAQIDVLCSFADTAQKNRYARPKIDDSFRIKITGGRHPVVETMTEYIPNDTKIDESNRTMIITGPNMAGKSSYMRQVALICLMAQIGSFIPVKHAEIGIVDRIFTRVGASDDISSGQSTFMVEMTETAYILNNATKNSLIILDEIGRGTSTFDGVAIAWAVAEHLTKTTKAKTLFATHYHVLNDLQNEIKGIKNYNIAVSEIDGKIIFLRKIIEGGTDKSYGIHVAKLAGIPNEVIERSKEIQFKLEEEDKMAEKIIVEKKTIKKDDTSYKIYEKIKQKKLVDSY